MGEPMKKSLILTSCLFAFNAMAADDFLVQKGTEQVSAARQELSRTISDLGRGGSVQDITRKLQQIQRRLTMAEKNLNDSLNETYPPNEPNYPPPQPNNRVIMSAKCEIDDDVDFTPGQMSGGTLKGSSIRAILSDCEAVAKANGSAQYSFGISNVTILQKPAYFVEATCEIDDDPDFTAGQIAVGQIAASDFLEAMNQCKQVATAAYKANGSAGIKNPKIDVNQYPVVADCHLDDDPDFTENQFVFGKIGAQSVASAVAQCAGIAKAVYGTNGSSGLRNIVQK
jgi:hypothetical protein